MIAQFFKYSYYNALLKKSYKEIHGLPNQNHLLNFATILLIYNHLIKCFFSVFKLWQGTAVIHFSSVTLVLPYIYELYKYIFKFNKKKKNPDKDRYKSYWITQL